MANAKSASKETDSRIIVDRLLKEAGWDIEDKTQVTTEEATKDGRADYLLLDARGRSLAVVETKRFNKDPYSAKEQAENYAKELQAPFIFLSNGEDTYFWDYAQADARLVDSFFSRYDLERISTLRKYRKPLSAIPIPDKFFFRGKEITVRPYQKDSLRTMDKGIEENKRRMLIEMATGTGKTLVIAMQMKRLFQAGLVERVLFLVDRIELANQAKETFDDYLSEYPSIVLYGGKRSKEGQIVIGTLPTIQSQVDSFTSGYFDLVVTDECHRSIYSMYRPLLLHFDAIHVGLTATPANFIDRNTYKFFDCWNPSTRRGKPTFIYGIRQAINDGYLAGYKVYHARSKISLEGIKWQGEDYQPQDLERVITVEDRNMLFVQEFKEQEEKKGSDHPRKTIVFAVTKKHAAQLTRFFNQAYPEYKGKYAEMITTDTFDPQRAIKRFKKEPLPVIAVSVAMLDTGFDYPAIENLMMCRPTLSPIFYQQMRGRGSRLCPEIGKTSFMIYDFVGNAKYFNDEGYDPFEQKESATRELKEEKVEEDLLQEEELKMPKREFVTVPKGQAPDEWMERKFIEFGPEGEKVDAREYKDKFAEEVSTLVDSNEIVAKVKQGKEITDEELQELAQLLNHPEYFFNEANLRDAYGQPTANLLDFIKSSLGMHKFPTKEERVSKAFDAWIIQKNFAPEQARVLRMLKNQYLAGSKADIADFNRPPISQYGGLQYALKVFGDEGLKQVVDDLQQGVFQ
ncbi:MAG TPA: DEAD/DEAH box helicase family protein [Candidatus Bathyarchaeia archaeon]|nr:DEAD/DEAH box helicase family protein [Candidatus Bathyarchaeia archaeon]